MRVNGHEVAEISNAQELTVLLMPGDTPPRLLCQIVVYSIEIRAGGKKAIANYCSTVGLN